MRIGIDASRANLLNKTGTEWYAFHLTCALFPLIKNEDEVILYLKEEPLPGWGALPKNFKFKILKWPPKFLWTLIRLSIEMVVNPVDLLFVPSHTIPFFCPKKTITTLHDIGFEHSKELYGQKSIGKSSLFKYLLNFLTRFFTLGKYGANEYDYHRFSARLALSKSQRILTVSEFSKQDIIQTYKINQYRVQVVPNGVDFSKFYQTIRENSSKIAEIQAKLNLVKPYLMALGRIEKKKNSLGLVEAFRLLLQDIKFKNYKLLLAGTSGLGSEEVFEKIKEFDLSKQVFCPGWIKAEYLPYILAGAEVFVMPSFFEGFGVPVLEAMAVGTPVVCSNRASLPEVVGDSGIMIEPSDPNSICQGIKKVLSDQGLKNRLVQSGYKRAQTFSWEKSGQKLAKIIYG